MGIRTIILSDTGISYGQALKKFKEADLWAQQHCPGYINYEVNDVSDFSENYDLLATYTFDGDQGYHWFVLRWQP